MKNEKYFIITIDAEADNQWDKMHKCTTENAKYLPRFQELAEKYDFKPVWLTTYEMANDEFFVEYFKEKQDKGLCEIGMHLHAWNNPPEYHLDKKTEERAYLIEYPIDIMKKKIEELDKILTKKFNLKPTSHRAGRWAINNNYYNLLIEAGYNVDCSVTPHKDWSKFLGQSGIAGSNYLNSSEKEYFIHDKLLEVPVTIRKSRYIQIENITSIKKLAKGILKLFIGQYQWIRPDKTFSVIGMKKVIKKCAKQNEYVMFMIHSSELMAGGSPNFKTKESIEKLYSTIEEIFKYSTKLGYKGITLREFYNKVVS